jgi:hypothetical protein
VDSLDAGEPTLQGSSWMTEQYFSSTAEPGGFPFTTTQEEHARRIKKSLRNFRGLTQTCRTIRNEYLPLYQKHTTYRICHLDMQEYLDTVLLKECSEAALHITEGMQGPAPDMIHLEESQRIFERESHAHKPRIHRNLVIDCKAFQRKPNDPEKARYPYYNYPEKRNDILPFLKFLSTAPSIHVRCGFNSCKCSWCKGDWAGCKDYLETLFDIVHRPKLAKWLEEDVEQVTLQWPPHIHFQIKNGHAKQWMSEWNGSRSFHGQDIKEWVEETGLLLSQDTRGSICFPLYDGLWDLEVAEEEDTETREEDKLFWQQVERIKRGRQHVRTRKRVSGYAKLERVGRGKGRAR